MHCRSAFTLVELLVVIGIIAVLSAILFPVFAKAREKARQANCQSNLRQIGMAVMQYSQDNDDQSPYAYMTGAQTQTWKQALDPYVKAAGIYACPSNPSSSTVTGGFPVSYAPNTTDADTLGGTKLGVFGGWDYGTSLLKPSAPIASIQTPSTTILILETTWGVNDYIITNGYFAGPNGPNGSSVSLFAGHSTKSDYLFADGHVKTLGPSSTLSTMEGGSGDSDYWTRDGSNLPTPSALSCVQTIMRNSINLYK